jgi:hypothetical protein
MVTGVLAALLPDEPLFAVVPPLLPPHAALATAAAIKIKTFRRVRIRAS